MIHRVNEIMKMAEYDSVMTEVRTEVRIQFGRSQRSDGSKPWSLRIEDARSHNILLEAKLDNDDFADLLSSTYSTKGIPAVVYSSNTTGKYHKLHSSATFKASYGEAWDENPKVVEWLTQAEAEGAEVSVHRNRNGWQCTARVYLDELPNEQEVTE